MEREQLKKMEKDEVIELCLDALRDAKANDDHATLVTTKMRQMAEDQERNKDNLRHLINELRDARQETVAAIEAFQILHALPEVPFNYHDLNEDERAKIPKPTEFARILQHIMFTLRDKDRSNKRTRF